MVLVQEGEVGLVIRTPCPGVSECLGLGDSAEGAVVIPLGVVRGIEVNEVNRGSVEAAQDVEVVAVPEGVVSHRSLVRNNMISSAVWSLPVCSNMDQR